MTTWNAISARAGRNDLPYLLAKSALLDETLDTADLPEAVTDAWTMAEWPLKQLDQAIWSNLYEQAADDEHYIYDGKLVEKTELPATVTLYRGCSEEGKYGFSWTSDLSRAQWFANRFGQGDPVYQIEASPDMVLARFDERRGESEWVLDPEQIGDDEPQEMS